MLTGINPKSRKAILKCMKFNDRKKIPVITDTTGPADITSAHILILSAFSSDGIVPP